MTRRRRRGQGAAAADRCRGTGQRLSRERKKDVAELAKAAEDLRAATSAGDGEKLRAAAKREREAVGRLMEAAEELGSEAGGATSATLDRIAETLRAATRDPEVERAGRAGRLDRERSATTGFGDGPIESSPPKKGGGKDGEGKGGGRKKSDDDAEALKRAKAELEKTEAARRRSRRSARPAPRAVVEEAEHALAKARDVLKERRAETKQAGSEVSKAKRKVGLGEEEGRLKCRPGADLPSGCGSRERTSGAAGRGSPAAPRSSDRALSREQASQRSPGSVVG